MRRTPMAVLAASLLLSPGFAGVLAATPAVAEVPPATPTVTATITDTVKQAATSEELQRAALARLEQSGQWRELAERTTALEAEFDALAASVTAAAELVDPIDLDRRLRTLHRAATIIVDNLASIVRRLEHDGSALESDARMWRERMLFLEARLVPPAVLERARSIETKLQGTGVRLRELRDSALLALDRASALQVRIDGARALVTARQERVRAQRLTLERSPIWELGAAPAQFEHVAVELRAAWRVLRDYLARDGAGLAGLFYDIDVGVAYGSDPEQVMRLLEEGARSVPEIMTNPAPRAMFKGFGDSSLDFRLLAWVHSVDVGLEAQNALRVAILRQLDKAGIAIPFPQRDLHIHSASDGAR